MKDEEKTNFIPDVTPDADTSFEEHLPPSNSLKYLLAGGIAGAVSRTATAPLDRLKVLLQTETKTHRSYSQIVSIKKGMLKIYNTGGIKEFFKGNGLNIIKIIPESALKFYAFEQSKQLLSRYHGTESDQLSVSARFMAGGIAGLVSQFAIYPIETIKTRVMAQINVQKDQNAFINGAVEVKRENNVMQSVKSLYKEGGFKGFYRGVGTALVGIVPYAGIDLAVFETLKSTWNTMYDTPMPTPIMLLCGMTSGTFGAVLVYPLSLVRTRLQAQGTPSHPTFYTSAFDVIHKTYKKEGIVGFYRGLAPTLLKVLPAVSISYTCYEHCKKYMELP